MRAALLETADDDVGIHAGLLMAVADPQNTSGEEVTKAVSLSF
jgi:hypothetical protein